MTEPKREVLYFYGKPECTGNAKQKEILRNAGYLLQVIDIINKPWTKSELLDFFQDMSIKDCVNLRAPQIKRGELDLDKLSDAEILDKMLEAPILIKRPLLQYGQHKAVGFESGLVARLLGETPEAVECDPRAEGSGCLYY